MEQNDTDSMIVKGGRGWTRREKIYCGRVKGAIGSYRCLVVNISRSGAMITLLEPDFVRYSDNVDDINLIGLRIASHFGDTFTLEFAASQVTVECELVRMGENRQDEDLVVFLGCRFLRELTDEECRQLEVRSTPFDGVLLEVKEPGEEPAPNAPVDPDALRDLPGIPPGTETFPMPPVVIGAPVETRQRPSAKVKARPVQLVDGGPKLDMKDLLRLTVKHRATDMHIKAGSPLRMRIDGSLREMGGRRFTSGDADGLARALLTADQFDRFKEVGDLDMAYSFEGVGRFRVNVLRSQDVTGMALRRIPEEVPAFDSLGLSPVCIHVADRPRGLVLVTGPTGSGKSTTLAAMVDHVNANRSCHIVTMEDPIEYIHAEKQSHVTQREIGRDTADFTSALKRAMRQDPDVILVGEMRDLETISLAVTAAETGHLVFATLHTTSAVLTVDRIVDVFPARQQRQIRMQLADCLQAIISQIMLPKRGGGLVVAQEVLVATDGVRALIRDGKTPQIGNMMQTGAKAGMHTLEDSLNRLIAERAITFEQAVAKANLPHLIHKDGKPGRRKRTGAKQAANDD